MIIMRVFASTRSTAAAKSKNQLLFDVFYFGNGMANDHVNKMINGIDQI